jgi:hypothetical protein
MHQSNVKKLADQMTQEGLLRRSRAVRESSKRGRVPATYELVAGERGNVEAIVEEDSSPGLLSRSQQLVIASIPGSKVVDLRRVTAQVGPASEMEWVALVDGEPQECFMAFEGNQAVDLANDLMAQLAAAEIHSRRASVTQIFLGHRFARGRFETD